jgi:DNA-binding transcriptional MerR regulator
MNDDLLDIGVVAAITGVAPSALRYYERLGLLEPAGRHGLRRTYRPDAIDRIALIVSAQASGFSLAEVHELLHAGPRTVRAQLAAKIDEIDERIAAMQDARSRLGHALTCEHTSLLECPTLRAGLREALSHRAPNPVK